MSSAQPTELPSEDVKSLPQNPEAQPSTSEPQETTQQTTNPDSNGDHQAATEAQPPMSKNALKRLKRQQQWEDGKDERRKRRKEKRHDRKSRRREQREALLAQGVDPSVVYPQRPAPTLVPVALVLDCDFEQYMTDKERISLCSQLTRCYADNRQARYRAHFWVSGWKGKVRERFETVLENQQKSWRGVEFFEGDFTEAAARARDVTKGEKGGKMIEPLQRSLDEKVPLSRDESDPSPIPEPEPEPAEEFKNIVYLTSDSPYTLERIDPHTSYIIGGLVDKNREKGLCYRRAREHGIRTAKLPIGQFMVMQSRQVLATNHVVEIMLRWLECEDWGKAFLQVIPKRKGGKLKGEEEGEAAQEAAGKEDADEEDEELDEQDEHEEALEALAEANAMDEAAAETQNQPAEPTQAESSSKDQASAGQ